MPAEVVLLGATAAAAADTLRRRTDSDVAVTPVPDPDDHARLDDAVRSARVVVAGGLPDGVELGPAARLIQNVGAGVDGYDLDRLPEDAYLCNVYGHSRAVAEHAIALLLAVRRQLPRTDAAAREGIDVRPDDAHRGLFSELRGDTLGVLGFGHIGRDVADLAAGFDMDVIAIRSDPPEDEPPDPLSFLGGPADLDRVLERSDAVVVALPLTDRTRNLLGEDELETMGEDAVLINVARGPIVEERALFDALEERTIAGAGLDVWYDEPDDGPVTDSAGEPDEEPSVGPVDEPDDGGCPIPSRYPFEGLDEVVLTPHVAGWSTETWDHRWDVIAENVDRVVRGDAPVNVVRGPDH